MGRTAEDAGDGRDRIPYVGSALVHVTVFALAVWASMADPPVLNAITYQIDIVSPPATSPDPVEEVPPEPEEELVVEQPEPEPVVEEEEEAVIEPEPEPEEVQDEPPAPEPEPPPAPAEPEEEREEEPAATEESETERSGEDLRVRMEGLQRDFPVYYENIIVQIRRCLRWQGPPNLEAQVYFVIRRDGTVDERDLDITRESGNIRFDYAAMAAVECAGGGRFGPLPDELPYDQLPVLMNFQPPG